MFISLGQPSKTYRIILILKCIVLSYADNLKTYFIKKNYVYKIDLYLFSKNNKSRSNIRLKKKIS